MEIIFHEGIVKAVYKQDVVLKNHYLHVMLLKSGSHVTWPQSYQYIITLDICGFSTRNT